MNLFTNKLVLFFSLLLFTILFYSPVKGFANVCPQKRNTLTAPKEYLEKINPLRKEPRHLKKGKVLAQIKAKPLACKQCHGMEGNGNGPMSIHLNPKPRNFTCSRTMEKISDGQLFWIIKNGSKGTSMPAYKHLSDKKIWQLVHYIRSLT
ncbi:MAG: cytochrome c [Nitrospinota bacterium]